MCVFVRECVSVEYDQCRDRNFQRAIRQDLLKPVEKFGGNHLRHEDDLFEMIRENVKPGSIVNDASRDHVDQDG